MAKIIIIGTSLSGKTTLVEHLRATTSYVISENAAKRIKQIFSKNYKDIREIRDSIEYIDKKSTKE